MLRWRLSDDEIEEEDTITDPYERSQVQCKKFLGFTTITAASGMRDSITFLAKNKLIDVISTTGGSMEFDLLKCMGDIYIDDFK